MKFPGKNKLSSLFNLLSGRHGVRPAIATGIALAAEGAGVGISIAALTGGLALTTIFPATGIMLGGAALALATAGSLKQNKKLKHENKKLKKVNKKLNKILKMNEEILAEQKAQRESKPAAPGPN